MKHEDRQFLAAVFFLAAAFLVFAFFVIGAHARDLGQWNDDPEKSAWYRSLKQPDMPAISCCGEADSYFCDEHARGSQVYCIIDDDRDNEKLKRQPRANGTVIEIPDNKLNHDPNLEGRGVVFLSAGGYVYCFIGAGGA